MNLKLLARQAKRLVRTNSPTILTGMACAGVVGTAVLAAKASVKADRAIEKLEYTSETEPTVKDKVKTVWKYYIPAAACGAATIGCCIGSNSINKRRNAAIAGAYAITQAAANEFKDTAAEVLDKKTMEEIEGKVAKKKVDSCEEEDIIHTGKGETLFLDSYSGRKFRSDLEYVRKVQNDLNAMILKEHYISLNEFYYALGIPQIRLAEDVGWSLYHEEQIDLLFLTTIDDKLREPCIVIDHHNRPQPGFSNLG